MVVKIIATLEPESDLSLAEEVDIVRLNLGKYPLRKWPKEFLFHHTIMYDVGQKLRILVPDTEEKLIAGREELKINLKPSFDSLSFNRIIKPEELIFGGDVVIRDGLILGKVGVIGDTSVIVRVSYKKDDNVPLYNAGVNFPGASYKRFWLSDFDKQAIKEAFRCKVFMLALSNVECREDILEAISGIGFSSSPIIVPKIETLAGVENLGQIITLQKKLRISIVVMIAQGDLFNELGPIEFVKAQEEIISVCKAEKIPVIVATGLLLSMKYGPLPSRAEIVALKSILEQDVDYLMLSDETVPDAFNPRGTVRFLRQFIQEVKNG